ncbi:MAG: hypothetical protein ACLSDQ_10640 [Adlercreutzia equolifaciens]
MTKNDIRKNGTERPNIKSQEQGICAGKAKAALSLFGAGACASRREPAYAVDANGPSFNHDHPYVGPGMTVMGFAICGRGYNYFNYKDEEGRK